VGQKLNTLGHENIVPFIRFYNKLHFTSANKKNGYLDHFAQCQAKDQDQPGSA
jgi:hypothetical protein